MYYQECKAFATEYRKELQPVMKKMGFNSVDTFDFQYIKIYFSIWAESLDYLLTKMVTSACQDGQS